MLAKSKSVITPAAVGPITFVFVAWKADDEVPIEQLISAPVQTIFPIESPSARDGFLGRGTSSSCQSVVRGGYVTEPAGKAPSDEMIATGWEP